MTKKQRVARTRGGGRYTEAEYRGKLRAAIRRVSMYWPPKNDCLNAGRRKRQLSGRHKYEYQCEGCGHWFLAKEMDVDHVTPAGGFQTPEEFGQWVERVLVEHYAEDGTQQLQRLCKENCHKKKTALERKKK